MAGQTNPDHQSQPKNTEYFVHQPTRLLQNQTHFTQASLLTATTMPFIL